MSQKKPLFGMSQSDKARLLAQVRTGTDGAGPGPSRSFSRTVDPSFRTFEGLPGYSQLQIQKSVARKLGVGDPYFTLHDGLSQDTAVVDGRTYLNFSSYDYLGLNGDQRILDTAQVTAAKYGISASASRVTAGERLPHRLLEKEIADLYQAEDAIVFVSGHATNVSTIETLFGPHDVIFYDSLSHNSLLLGAQASGARRYSYPTNDMQALRALLEEHRYASERALIVTEGLFGMDGCICDLPTLVQLREEFGTFLMVDEAHSMGVIGRRGLGVHDHYGMDPSCVDIWMGTLSKTFCGCGGYIAGSRVLTELLRYTAPGFVYSVGMPPLLAAVSRKAIRLMLDEPERVAQLEANSRCMLDTFRKASLDTGRAEGHGVIPVMIGDSLSCVLASDMLRERGVLVLPIIYPAVEEGRARLRFFVSASHSEAQIREACMRTIDVLPAARERAEEFLGRTRE